MPSATSGWYISFACVDVATRPKTNEGCVSIIEVGDILQSQQDNTWREVVSFAAVIYSFSATDIAVDVCHRYLTLRLLMSHIYMYIYIYIYGAPILDVSRSHTTTHHSR